MKLIWIAATLALIGCGGNGGTGIDATGGDDQPDGTPGVIDAPPGTIDSTPAADAAIGFVPLITADWSLGAGQEGYWCATRTMTEDVYAGTLKAIAPLGTHHTVIALIENPTEPDNPGFGCGPEFGEFWASGAGTPVLDLPDGVGLLAPAGSQLRLSLHLFNASDGPLSGNSGLEVIPLPAAEVTHVAGVSYRGPLTFAIPGNGTPYTTTHTAALGAQTAVAIFPHMHQLGTHFRARILNAAGNITLWDDDYQFDSQEFAPLASIAIPANSTLETQCTWVNNTGSTVFWGDSSTAEMCFTILMTY